MNTTSTATTTITGPATEVTAIPACCPCPHPVDCSEVPGASGPANDSRVFLVCLRTIATFLWAASQSTLRQILLAYLQSTVTPTWRSMVAGVLRGAAAPCVDPAMHETPQAHPVAQEDAKTRRVSWSYLRGVSLALSELCQDCHFGGGRISLSAILDLMRQHQSAFVPLGPHVEKDVPKRLIQLANENVVFFDPFEEYVIVPEKTRQKYDSQRERLLEEGVDPANLSVFGAALTRDLSPSKRVTKAAVASYKAQFLLTQPQQEPNKPQPPGREESLLSIADAIRPPDLTSETEVSGSHATRRGHSIVMDMAKIIGCQREGGWKERHPGKAVMSRNRTSGASGDVRDYS